MLTAGSPKLDYPSTVLSKSPLVYWRLGEASGTTATDASGNGKHGTYVNSPTLGVAGLIANDANTGATFASTAVVEVADTTDLTAFTVTCWHKTTANTGTHYLMDRALTSGGAGDQLFIVQMDAAGTVTATVVTGAGSLALASTATINNGNPHHVALTFEPYTGSNNVKLYIDGTLDQQGQRSGTLSTADIPFRAGNNWGRFRPALGTLDEVAYYTYALSAGQIAADYAAGI